VRCAANRSVPLAGRDKNRDTDHPDGHHGRLYSGAGTHAQLQEALAAAERANNAKTEFISRISHDIRTPISAITSMTAFAREDADDREKLLHDLDRIEASNTFLLSLINDVLDISKIDSGKIELHPEPYPYNDSYREHPKHLRAAVPEKRPDLHTDAGTKPKTVRE
jgi:signal transduction histidine kinase